MTQVIVVVGAGQIGQAIARRVGVAKHVLLADMRPNNTDAAAKVVGLERGQSIEHKLVLKSNGQRWCALAVQDYESRALPQSYGGGNARSLTMKSPLG